MIRLFPIIIGFLTLTACAVRVGPPSQVSSSTASQTAESEDSSPNEANAASEAIQERETHNVTYRGIVQPAGISIYMQGSHRLLLSDRRFLLLESENVDLNGYVGEEVEVSGSTRPTVEANGIIMRVEKTKLILPPQEESPVPEQSSVQGTAEEKPAEPEKPIQPIPTEPTQPTESTEDLAVGPEPAEREPAEWTEQLTEVIEAMAKENFSAEHWTQEYCSSHIGFCIPVHRNWWYKSFGTTTSTLWHVEVGNSPVLNLGDGHISINLLPGDLFLENQETTNVQVQGSAIVGLRPWSGDRHFEIRAGSALEPAVRYMIEHINPYEGN
ncbi:hypothetical protein HYZ98_03285 [Candidatus Peregrinibacteria bacterium]|nr:hypothetical protein [Candidatus Peregrinibacteria bacterium]